MRTHSVQELACGVWKARESATLERDPMILARLLALAVAHDVETVREYDPETDVRVAWLRGVIGALRQGRRWVRPVATGDLEYAVAWLIGALEREPVGRERAVKD